MPVNVVQPMVSIEPYLTTDLLIKGKEAELSRQFYEKQLELLKTSLKLNFFPENEESLNNAQLYPTPNTTFSLSVSELHSIIPLGRTAGALREGWTGIMRDHLRRIIPHTTWYFKRSAFSHPDTRKRAAPLFKCEAVCAERTCPNTIKMCATKSDPLRVNVKFGQAMCVHTLRRRLIQTTLSNLGYDSKINGRSTVLNDNKPARHVLKRPASCATSPGHVLKRPATCLTSPTDSGTPSRPSSCSQYSTSQYSTPRPASHYATIKRPVAVRLTPEDRKRSYNRLRSLEDKDAPSAFHIVASPTKRTRIDSGVPTLFNSPTLTNFGFNFDVQVKPFMIERGIAT